MNRLPCSPAALQRLLAFAGLVVLMVVFSVASENFLQTDNLVSILQATAVNGVLAIACTLVIVSGGIDLSVGAVLVLSGMVIGMTMNAGLSIWLAVPLALGVSLVVGAINGLMIAYVGVPPFVVTLGMLSIARSLAMVLSNNRMVYEFGPDQPKLLALGGGFVDLPLPLLDAIRIPSPVLFLLVLLVLTAYALRWTRWGRYVFAIGGNEGAATLTGVPVKRIKISVYMFCSFTAGIAGVLEVGWLGTITTGLGQGMELTVIAAAVIGGANLSGGIGTAFGAVVGAALIEVIRNSLTLLGISTFWQGTFVGSFIIVAVLFDRLRARGANE